MPGENQHVLFFNAIDHDWPKPKTSTEPLAVLLRYLQNFKYQGYRSGIHAWGSNPQKSRRRKVLLKKNSEVLFFLAPNVHKKRLLSWPFSWLRPLITHDDYNESPGLCDPDREGSNSFMISWPSKAFQPTKQPRLQKAPGTLCWIQIILQRHQHCRKVLRSLDSKNLEWLEDLKINSTCWR